MKCLVPFLSVLAAGAVWGAGLTATRGQVSLYHAGSAASAPAAAGQAVTAGDRLVTAAKAGATVQLDSANECELGPETEVVLAESDEQHHRMQLSRGTLLWRVYGAASVDVAVETPNIRARPANPGEYEFAVKSGVSEIAAYSGDIEAYAPQGSAWVNEGKRMWIRGPAAQPEFRVGYAFPWWRRAALLFNTLGRRMNAAGMTAGGGGGPDGSSHSHHPPPASPAKSSSAHAESPRAGTASHTSNLPSPGGPPPGRR
jgi:hypothetical protein